MRPFGHLAVLGGGAWGTALALTAHRAGRTVTLWARSAEIVAGINERHENPSFLPGIDLAPEIVATRDLGAAVDLADAVLVVVPAQFVRTLAQDLRGLLRPGTPVLLCAKGIETGSGLLMTELAEQALPGVPVAVLSGPTFAIEVARGLPTAVAVAATTTGLAEGFAAALGTRSFRPYVGDDPVGAEVGGAVKNVLAIACGIVAGRGLGENARAALITRGLAEMTRLALAKGGRRDTLMGLAGMGDLILTCTSPVSRNHALGRALGEGRDLAELLAGRRSVVEGVATAGAVVSLAARLGVDMPIATAVDAILHHGASIDATIDGLLARPFRAE